MARPKLRNDRDEASERDQAFCERHVQPQAQREGSNAKKLRCVFDYHPHGTLGDATLRLRLTSITTRRRAESATTAPPHGAADRIC